jgi:hypothetical protein
VFSYLKYQKTVAEICKRLVVSSEKYRKCSRTEINTSAKNGSRHYPSAPQDTVVLPVKTVIAFGNASFTATMKGKKASPAKLIKKKLKQM